MVNALRINQDWPK